MTRPTSQLRVFALLPLIKLLLASVVSALPHSVRDAAGIRPWSTKVEDGDPAGWLYLAVAVVLVLLGGVFAGLTIALMGQDEIYLQVLANSGEGSERKNASKVLRLLKRGKHWVLVSLLLSNVITNETLPIMLDRSLGGGWQAVVGSTVLIVIFGEIVPQSICVRYGLPIGAFMSYPTLLLMWLLAPVAWPTAKLLDYLLGEDHGTTYKKAGLKTLVTLHRTLGTSPDERLNHDEVTIISAVLDLKAKPVGSIMTPMEDVFTLAADTVLNDDMMNTILSEGYSRIPIYAVGDPENFIGMLLVKLLITYDPEDCMQVQDFHLATLPETRPETSCLDIINFFQEGKSHMILVSQSPGDATGALGVCTLEDVIEELIGEEIVDESDVFVDVHKAIRRMNPVPYYRIPKQTLDDINEHSTMTDSETLTKTLSSAMERKMSGMSDTNAVKGATTKFTRRRHSGGTEPMALQKKSDELYAHLKHLGPSNLASKPKSTRINAVKIKPGNPSPVVQSVLSPRASKNVVPGVEPRSESRNSLPPTSSRGIENIPPETESSGLLAAGFEASDAVRAHIGYGTLGGSPKRDQDSDGLDNGNVRAALLQRTKSTPASVSARIEINVQPDEDVIGQGSSARPENGDGGGADSNKEQNNDARHNFLSISQQSPKTTSTTSLPAKLVISPEADADPSDDEGGKPDENSSGSTMKSDSSYAIGRKNTARSGSVQERQIDLGGVRKVVLDIGDEEHDPSHSHLGHASSRSSDGLHRHDEEDEEDASESKGLLDGSTELNEDGSSKDKKKRKKKRSKKKKGAKDGATSPAEH